MKSIVVKAPAKINLILEIREKRPDGYHELKTVMHALTLSDTLRITGGAPGVKVGCDHPDVPIDQGNLVHRAAVLLARSLKVDPAVKIFIRKRIPLAAGMGGGSSDAAAALIGLAKYWHAPRNFDLLPLAKKLGSDVPFFLHGGCALGIGRGERIFPWPDMPGMRIAVINPGISVSTAMVYKKFKLALTRKRSCINMMRLALFEKNIDKISGNLRNDLEMVTVKLVPEIVKIKQRLKNCGANGVMMTGSGPTVFGLVPSLAVEKKILREFHGKYPVVCITRTQEPLVKRAVSSERV